MNCQFVIGEPELGRADKGGMRQPDRVDRPLQLSRPEIEEFSQFGETGGDIVILPEKSLKDAFRIRHPIEDLGRRQRITGKLPMEGIICPNHLVSPALKTPSARLRYLAACIPARSRQAR